MWDKRHRAHIRALLVDKRDAGHAKNGVRLMRAALSTMLSDAVEDGLIPANPALRLGRRERIRQGERQQNIRPMTLEQRDTFLAVAWQHAPLYALLFELLAKSGMRPSEAFALRAEDLDLVAGKVLVERAWVLNRMKATKTHEHRWVDLTPALIAPLKSAAKKASGHPLFTTAAGTPLDKSRVGKVFRRLLVKASLSRFRLYDLRHTYASLRLAGGAPITYVSAQLGHANPITSLRHYARWTPSGGREWVENDTASNRRGDGRGRHRKSAWK